jgi:hypothetical protein
MLIIKKWDLNEIKMLIRTPENAEEKRYSIRMVTASAMAII